MTPTNEMAALRRLAAATNVEPYDAQTYLEAFKLWHAAWERIMGSGA